MLCPIAVIVREYERQGHENKGQKEMAKKTKTAIVETISHGDFQQERILFVNLHNVSSVKKMLNSCCYLLMPDADYEEGAAMVSTPYKEIVAQRLEAAKRVSRELLETGESNIGWVTYTAELEGERLQQRMDYEARTKRFPYFEKGIS